MQKLITCMLTGAKRWLGLGFAVLSFLGIRVSPLLAVFGGISFILGFALQDTIGNAVSGLMIMMNRPFDLGHFVRAGNESGFVESMTIMSTKIRTADNQIIQFFYR